MCFANSAIGQVESGNPWPREIPTPQGTVVIYQPQADKLDGNRLDARAAVALELNDAEAPVFGAIWFTARIITERVERTATFTDVEVTRSRFAEPDEEKAAQLKKLLETEMPKWDILISLDPLTTTLEIREQRINAASAISTEPPIILFMPEAAVLITIDGEPKLKREDNSDLMRVINTPFTILLDTRKKTHYLHADGQSWYSATDMKGTWAIATSMPKGVAALAPKPDLADSEGEVEDPEEDAGDPGPPPKIVVATQPTELISATGEPEYTPISGTELLYMSNTESDVLLHLSNQLHY